MALSNMQAYDEEIRTRTIELLGQDTDKFNAASDGAIILSSQGFMGGLTRASFYQSIAGAIRRVDRNIANASASSTALAESEHVGVKVAGGFGPIVFEPSQLTWLQSNAEEAINVIAQGFADALMADQLNTAVGAVVAAIENVPALVEDVSAAAAPAGALTQRVLNRSHGKFKDAKQNLRAMVMNGNSHTNLVDAALVNTNRLFESSNILVQDILGKRVIVSDIPALEVSGTPNKVKVVSLVADAVIVDNTSDIQTLMLPVGGKQRIETTWQADYTFGIKLKGFAWDTANGGTSPDDTALFTGSNWDSVMSDNKHLAGVLAIADVDQLADSGA